MTISVSVISHAFFTEKGVSRALSRDQCPVSQVAQGDDADLGSGKVDSGDSMDGRNEKAECEMREGCKAAEGPPTPVKESATQIVGRGEKTHSRKRGNRRRGARRQQNLEKENKMHMVVPEAQDRAPASVSEMAGMAEVLVRDIREECATALGIVKEDLELYGLCHIPRTAERARLLKDKSGVMHVGVMVRNSDLSLRTIEELVINKDMAEQEVEICQVQIREKADDFQNLKLKYDKLTEEVLRLRTMLDRANRLRRESEKATEILRIEFEKLVKNMFMDRTECPDEETVHDQDEA